MRLFDRTRRSLVRTFLTGLATALPLAATVLVFVWAARLLYEWVGPGSFVGAGLRALGFGVTGSEFVGYAFGVAFVAVAIFVLGLLVQTRLRTVAQQLQHFLRRVPLVGGVYDLMSRFVGMLAQRDERGAQSMSPVWLHFGGPGHAAVLGLLSTPAPVQVNGEPYLAVLVPTAPVPIGGGLLYVPAAWVTPAEVGLEALTSIYVSMGMTSRQYLRPADGAVTPPS